MDTLYLFQKLPADLKYEVFFKLPYSEILRQCNISRELAQLICNNTEFWYRYTTKEIPISREEFNNIRLHEKYLYFNILHRHQFPRAATYDDIVDTFIKRLDYAVEVGSPAIYHYLYRQYKRDIMLSLKQNSYDKMNAIIERHMRLAVKYDNKDMFFVIGKILGLDWDDFRTYYRTALEYGSIDILTWFVNRYKREVSLDDVIDSMRSINNYIHSDELEPELLARRMEAAKFVLDSFIKRGESGPYEYNSLLRAARSLAPDLLEYLESLKVKKQLM